MSREETKRFLMLIGEHMQYFAMKEKCPCHLVEDDRNAEIFAGFALDVWQWQDPTLTMHALIYAYFAGKTIAEEQMLEILTMEKER